ncbi:PACE efflux transporter [Castellaniella caeni]|uniref:PACE efflux transporter n=1 Tax=Castellaniella caeni TaxID=266123 RepID=UPI000C9FD32E|nr:PACE efflux transporter [Castellaniella caeni]
MPLRTFADRVRHALLFEIIGLIIVIPGAAYLFDQPMSHMGVVGVGASVIATVWNFIYNLGFDHAMLRLVGHARKSLPVRILHTAAFEIGLLFALVPLIAWYLDMSLWAALVMDAAFVAFYLVYTFVYNLIYDWAFPIHTAPTAQPDSSRATTAH